MTDPTTRAEEGASDADMRALIADLERELGVTGTAGVFRKALSIAKEASRTGEYSGFSGAGIHTVIGSRSDIDLVQRWCQEASTIPYLQDRIKSAESRAASAEAEVERFKVQRLAQIDYGVALQRIIEAICHRRPLPEAGATAAPHHHAMALAAEASASALRDRVAVLESALNDLLPGKLFGESWGEADSSRVSISTSFGAIRAARAALKESTHV